MNNGFLFRTYLKIKSYRRKSVSSDFSVLNWQLVIIRFYIIKKQSHWIPGQARNDKKTQKTYFEIGYSNLPSPLFIKEGILSFFLYDIHAFPLL